jgi:hypothetical protein
MTTEKNLKKPVRRLGVWLDHAGAYLVEMNGGEPSIESVSSDYRQEWKEGKGGNDSHFGDKIATNNEYGRHRREEQQIASFYKTLTERIRYYDDVLLFGPSDAKQELYNILAGEKPQRKIRINVQPADKMNEAQLKQFVKTWFDGR